MNEFFDVLSDELLEDIVCEYDDLEDIDVEEILSNLNSSISQYLYDNPEDYIFKEYEFDVDFSFKDDGEMPSDLIERIEPKTDICG